MDSAPRFRLEPYGPDDLDIFLGRDPEVTRLYELVCESNVALVYGSAKTGKTSLVNCGLASRFNAANWLVVHVKRNGGDLNEALRTALINLLLIKPEQVGQFSLGKLLYCLFLNYLKPVYLVFDQFEELYLDASATESERSRFMADIEEVIHRQKRKSRYEDLVGQVEKLIAPAPHPHASVPAGETLRQMLTEVAKLAERSPNLPPRSTTFFGELETLSQHESPQLALQAMKERILAEAQHLATDVERTVYDNLSCKVIVIVREEYVARLNDFEKKVPELIHKKLRLEPLPDTVLNDPVIPGLCRASGLRLVEESPGSPDSEPDTTAMAIVRQVRNKKGIVNLMYLNFYLDTLWHNAPQTPDGLRHVTPALIEETGPVYKLLENLLEEQKNEVAAALRDAYPEVTPDTVGQVLSEFVTPEGKPESRNRADIRLERITPLVVDECLGRLEQAGILRHDRCDSAKGADNRFELTDEVYAQHIHTAWSEPQRRYFSVRNMLRETRGLHTLHPDQALPDAALALVMPHETRLKVELLPEEWKFWEKNKVRIQRERRNELRKERIMWGVLISMIVVCLGVWLWMEKEKKQHLARMEYNRLVQLLDQNDERRGTDSVGIGALDLPIYDNLSLKYQVALAAQQALPTNTRAQEWLERLKPLENGTPFYQLSIDALGTIRRAGFLPDGRIFAMPDDGSDPQIWKVDTTQAAWSVAADTSIDWVIPLPRDFKAELRYGTDSAKAQLRKLLSGEKTDSLLATSTVGHWARRGERGGVKLYQGTPIFPEPPVLLKGHARRVVTADFWTYYRKDIGGRETPVTRLLTADGTGLIRVYQLDTPCHDSTCLAKLLPAEKSDLGLELDEADLHQLALSRDWTKLTRYLFKIEDRYHALDKPHGGGLEKIVNRLCEPRLLQKQAPEAVYRFWRRVAAQTDVEEPGPGKAQYVAMKFRLERHLVRFLPDSPAGKEIAAVIRASENRRDVIDGVRFSASWSQRFPNATFALRQELYNRAIRLNALESSDVATYLQFARQSISQEKSIFWVIRNLSLLKQHGKFDRGQEKKSDPGFEKLYRATYAQVRTAIATLSEEAFRSNSNVELMLSVANDTTWSAVRVAEYLRRQPEDPTYYAAQLVEAHGNLSYYQLMAGNFLGAITSARQALSLPGEADRDWVNTNLALGYLLNGNYPQAESLYRRWKDRPYTTDGTGRPFRDLFLEDLDEVERQQKIPTARRRDVDRIRALLTPLPGAASPPRSVASASRR